MSKMQISVEDCDYEVILIALAKLSLSRPGWYPACIRRIVEEIGYGAENFEEYRKHGPDPRRWVEEPASPGGGLRPLLSIIRAHDTLHPIVTREIPLPLDELARQSARVALDVLCWVLEHEHSDGFPRSLKQLEEFARVHGFELREGRQE